MARGGSRKHAPDCKCGNCPKVGRKKQERPVDGNVARKIKARLKAEELWVELVGLAAKKARDTGHTSDLRNALEYLDNRDLGNTTDNVNHMHDKPMEVNATLSLGEGMKLAMERADERLRNHKR